MSTSQPFRLKKARHKVKVSTKARHHSSHPPDINSTNNAHSEIDTVRHTHSAPLRDSRTTSGRTSTPPPSPLPYCYSDLSEPESIEEGRVPKSRHPVRPAARQKRSGIVAFLSFFRRSQYQSSAGGLINEAITSPRLQPLQLNVRARYRPEQKHFLGKPLPLLTIWVLAICFVCVIMIPDLNMKMTSIPVHSARSLLTAEEPVGKADQGPPSSSPRKLGQIPASTAKSEAKASPREEKESSSGGDTQKGSEGRAADSQEEARRQAQGDQVRMMGSEEEVFWFDPASDGGPSVLSADGVLADTTDIGDWATNSQVAGEDSSGTQGAEAEGASSQGAHSVHWPNKLILTMAVGYGVENVSTIVRTFQRFIGGARLVLFVDQPIRGWEPNKGVVIQRFHKPQVGLWSRLPLWLMRFRLYKLFLETVQGKGAYRRHSTVIFCDARDVAFLGDPFPLFRNSSSVYLFQESTAFPDASAKKLGTNHKWVSACYGAQAAFAMAGKRVVNAGFMAGTFHAMARLAGAMAEEAERLGEEACTRLWGSDQAILNYLVRSDALRPKVPFILEDNEHGAVMQRFSRKAVVHITLQEDNEEAEPVVRNMEGRPILAIHGYDRYSDTHEVVKQLM